MPCRKAKRIQASRISGSSFVRETAPVACPFCSKPSQRCRPTKARRCTTPMKVPQMKSAGIAHHRVARRTRHFPAIQKAMGVSKAQGRASLNAMRSARLQGSNIAPYDAIRCWLAAKKPYRVQMKAMVSARWSCLFNRSFRLFRDLRLRALGFEGAAMAGPTSYRVRGGKILRVDRPHHGDHLARRLFGRQLIALILSGHMTMSAAHAERHRDALHEAHQLFRRLTLR